jgi:methionyl aminopeptidase
MNGDVKLKSPNEIERLAEIGAAAGEVLSLLLDAVDVGVTGSEVDTYADELIAARGFLPTFKRVRDYTHATCINMNDVVAHGVPTGYRFEEGDLIGIDVALTSAEGLVADTAWTVLLGEPYDEAERLQEGGLLGLARALAACTPGAMTGDIGHAVATAAKEHGLAVVRDLAGHGTGYALHEDPVVYNLGSPGEGYPLQEGLVIAIEPMLTTGSGAVVTLDDCWSIVTEDGRLSSLYELTVAITESGLRILTPPPRPLPLNS